MRSARRLGWQLQHIERQADGHLRLTYGTPKGRRHVKTRSLALTVPAYTAASLLQAGPPAQVADLLQALLCTLHVQRLSVLQHQCLVQVRGPACWHTGMTTAGLQRRRAAQRRPGS